MTTIEKIQEISRLIKDKSEELMRLLCSDDVVCWMTDEHDNVGKKVDGEYAHTAFLSDILGWDAFESVYLRTPIESLKYEIEVAKIEKKSAEGSIKNFQVRIDDLEKKLKEMENN